MSKHGITLENLLSTYPEVLKKDKRMLALATITAKLLIKRLEEIDRIRIYPQIDKLPEDLLDILAYDLKVDWYNYNHSVSVKRSQIKSSFRIHRTLGTVGAMEKALNNLYPGTELEEWFNYGGDPYYFRVLLDVTDQQVDISHNEVVRIINIFKSRRSHLQDSGLIYRSRVEIAVGVSGHYATYSARLCGTFPVTATQGGIQGSGIEIGAKGSGFAYDAPMCGTAPGSLM